MPRALINSCLEQRRPNLKITQKSRIPVYNTISSLCITQFRTMLKKMRIWYDDLHNRTRLMIGILMIVHLLWKETGTHIVTTTAVPCTCSFYFFSSPNRVSSWYTVKHTGGVARSTYAFCNINKRRTHSRKTVPVGRMARSLGTIRSISLPILSSHVNALKSDISGRTTHTVCIHTSIWYSYGAYYGDEAG